VLAVIVVVIFSGFIFTDKMFFGTDMIPMGYMMRKAVADHWRADGTIPVWNPYILCGLPVVDAMHGDLFYPFSAFYVLMPLHKALGYKLILHVWLAGITMYFLLRTLGLRRRSSLVGGVAYMVAPYFLSLIYAGHDGKMFVTALFPLCLLLLERFLRRPGLMRSALFGGSIGLLLLTAHPQMAYFASWGLGIYLVLNIPRLVRSGALARCVGFLLIAVIVGIGIGCVQLLPTYFYTTNYSPRTGGVDFDFAASWSLHPEEIVSLLYPSFVGYNDSYWGRNPFKLNTESPGPIVLLLAIGGFILLLRRREMLPWLVLFIFCPIYALGAHTPLFKAIFYGVPGAKFLRAPSIIMFMFSCSASVLAAFFIDSRFTRKPHNTGRRVVSGLIVFLVFATIVFTAGRGALLDVWKNFYAGMEGKAGAIAVAGRALNIDAALLLVFGGLALVLIQTAYARKWRGALWLGIISVGILVTSLSHSLRFIDYIGVGEFQRMDPMIEYISKDDDIFRTLPVTGSSFYNRNYLPLFDIETANGFYDNRIRYYDTLSGEGFQNLFHTNIMGIANIKYILTGQRVDHPDLALRRDFGQAFVYENRGFLPRAFLVHNAVVAGSDSAAIDIMMQPDFDPSRTIVLHGGEPLEGDSAVAGETVAIELERPGEVVIKATVTSPGYLFYSGNYLPYWKAYVDGREVPVVRCDVAMRAVYLDPGDHTIEMKYVSRWYRTGALVCLISCLFVGLSVAAGLKFGKGRSRRA
jgi:hypothetical protein